MQSFKNFKKDVIRALEVQLNGRVAVWPKDKALSSVDIKNLYAYFLFDSGNEIKYMSHINLVLDTDELWSNTTKSYPEMKKEMEEGKFNPKDITYKEIDYQLELDFYWYLQEQYKANYLSICELEIIGEKYYLTSKFLNLSDMTEFIDIKEVFRNTNDGQLIFNKTALTEDKSKILDNVPGILELFSSRMNRNWSEKDLKTLGDLYTKHDDLGKFNTEAEKENTRTTELDSKIKDKLVLQLIELNGGVITSEISSSNSAEFKIVSITDKVRLLQSKNIPLFQCIIELESQLLWSTSVNDDSTLKKQLEDIISSARNGSPADASTFMFSYIVFRIRLDFPNISEEKIITSVAVVIDEFKKQNLML